MTGIAYLGGGGAGEDEALLWDEMLEGCRRLLYWPFALKGAMLADADAWLRDQISRRGSSAEVVTWTTLGRKKSAELDGFDLLFVGGGNTFRLLKHLKDHGLVEPVRQWVQAGGNYYGGSAGAVIATDSIAIAEHEDSNNVGLLDLDGLGLLPGIGFLPHYASHQENLARSLSRRYRLPIVAVPEAAGLIVEGAAVRVVGPEAVWTVDSATANRHEPGSLLPFH